MLTPFASLRSSLGLTESRPTGWGRAPGQRGVALVITLIMLAVITVITVIFLATARRNRSTTVVRIDQTTAEYAAESAYQHATGKIIERVLNDRSLLSFDFFVSKPLGYGLILSGGQVIRPFESNAIPRVLNASNTVDVYLDLDRARNFDDPGNATNRPFGDPIWLGILDRPWFPHSRTNRFVARMAYLVQPVGKSMDVNTIHHDTAPAATTPSFGYMRNQGLGPWELNFAAFLHEFNPGFWDYNYANVSGRPNTSGRAFQDALSIVRYREGWPADAQSVLISQSFAQLYPDSTFAPGFPSGSMDVYSDGNLGYPVGADISVPDDDSPTKTTRWPGGETTNHFFHLQEFFDHADVGAFSSGRSNKVTHEFYEGFSNTLSILNVHGQPNSSAYYRMMAQLGTQTGSDFEERINLNFVDHHATFTNLHATNFVPWDASPELAVAFFTNVAERIFLAQSNEFNPLTSNQVALRSMLEIPVYPTNRYSSAVHRILQMTANIYDATRTNRYPSIFRPLFGQKPGDQTVYITGFVNDDRLSTLQAWLADNTNGIPLVVGAKKGFPNFNEFTLRSDILVARKLEVTRTALNAPVSRTNQMYVFGVSNYFGAEAWNSYDVERGAGPYPRALRITVTNFARSSMTNSLGFQTGSVQYAAASMTVPANSWYGGLSGSNAFRLPLNTNQVFLSNAVYVFSQNTFANISTNRFEDLNNQFPIPDCVLTVSNRLMYWMEEPGLDRILDFVSLEDRHSVDVHRDLLRAANPYLNTGYGGTVTTVWQTNRVAPNGPTYGIINQINISRGQPTTTLADWREFSQGAANINENDKAAAIAAFQNFLGLPASYTNDLLAMQAPFSPSAKLVALSTWQANDPLVHYHPEDLRLSLVPTNQYFKPSQVVSNVQPSTLQDLNKSRYAPWYGSREDPNYGQPPINAFAYKDPGVNGSVDWVFPSNRLATAGLLGRVHRGTPWQSIYLKSEVVAHNDWVPQQSSDEAFVPGRGTISRTYPTNDWLLLDLFTTGIDERQGRGLVSINQTNLETWSALFSGVLVLSNNLDFPVLLDPKSYEELYIQPSGGVSNGFFQIFTNIYQYQRDKGRPLTSIGELIRNVPKLTTESPFLNLDPAVGTQMRHGLDDFAYEQIPQQIIALLRVGQPRFVVYAYGQALKPERINPGTGEVENYQVTAEFATRTVLRLEGDPRNRVRVVVESFNILPPD